MSPRLISEEDEGDLCIGRRGLTRMPLGLGGYSASTAHRLTGRYAQSFHPLPSRRSCAVARVDFAAVEESEFCNCLKTDAGNIARDPGNRQYLICSRAKFFINYCAFPHKVCYIPQWSPTARRTSSSYQVYCVNS